MSRRQHVTELLPELMFVEQARRRAKLSMPAMVERITNLLDWQAVDEAGNNLGTLLRVLRDAAKRAT